MSKPIPRTESVMAAICARVEAGDSLDAIGRIEGLPSRSVIYGWLNADADFAARYARAAAAQQAAGRAVRGLYGRRRLADPESGEAAADWRRFGPTAETAILDGLAAGRTLKDVCADPALPCARVVGRRVGADEAFAERYAAACQAGAGARGRALNGRRQRGLESWDEAWEETICDRVAAGESLAAICRDPALPCETTVRRRLAASVWFGRAYWAARRMRADAMFDEIVELADDDRDDWQGIGGGGAADPEAGRQALARAALKLRARQWVVARLAPHRYGADPDPLPPEPEPRDWFRLEHERVLAGDPVPEAGRELPAWDDASGSWIWPERWELSLRDFAWRELERRAGLPGAGPPEEDDPRSAWARALAWMTAQARGDRPGEAG